MTLSPSVADSGKIDFGFENGPPERMKLLFVRDLGVISICRPTAEFLAVGQRIGSGTLQPIGSMLDMHGTTTS
jgi:hypothetical protein